MIKQIWLVSAALCAFSAGAIPSESVSVAEALLGRPLTDTERQMGGRDVWRQVQRTDELLADWIAQDARLAPREYLLDNEKAGERLAAALERGGAKAEPGVTLAERLKRYRENCLHRRATRLARVMGEAPQWAYARHYVMGGSHYAYTECLSDAQAERVFRKCGSALCLADAQPDGFWKETVLFETKEGCIRDVDVSPDGKRLLFSYRSHDRKDDFHLYEMDLASRAITQLTSGKGIADYEGCYLPDGSILFNSTRCMQIVDCWWTEVSNLYRCDAKGSNITRITFDQVHDNYPAVTWDGRILYTRWEYNDRSQIYTQPLFQMALDGTGQQALYGDNSWFPTTLIHARTVPQSPLFFAIATGHHSNQPGELVRVDPREGRQEAQGVWAIEPLRRSDGKRVDAYGQTGRIAAYPYPLDEATLLLSYLPEGWNFQPGRRDIDFRDNFMPLGLYWLNVDGEREQLLPRVDRVPCGRPVPVKPRTWQVAKASLVDRSKTTGTFYVQDVYAGEGMKGVPRGTVKTLRVVSIEYRVVGIGSNGNGGRGGGAMVCTPPSVGNAAWDPKIPVGDAVVHEDGSVFFTADAQKPVYFMLLDEKGRMVQSMRSWVTLQPGENASCVGCHESKNGAPLASAKPTKALLAGAQKLSPILDRERGISFAKDIQPILNRRCVACHAAGITDKPDLSDTPIVDAKAHRIWSQAYLSLTHAQRRDVSDDAFRANPEHKVLNWIPAASEPSLLKPYFAGSNTSRLFAEMLDKGHAKGITDAEIRMLAMWTDLCVPFCGDYVEANLWSPNDWKRYDYVMAKRRIGMTDEERRKMPK